MTTRDWVEERLGGYVRLSIPERQEAVAELTAEGMTQREVADVLGVSQPTVARDSNESSDDGDQDEGAEADSYESPEPTPEEVARTQEIVAAAAELAEEERRRRVTTDNLRAAVIVLEPLDLGVEVRASSYLQYADRDEFTTQGLRDCVAVLAYLADHWKD
jgi:predicted transcriptional regulator